MASKKDKSDIVSGLGAAFQILKRLRDGGASDAEIRRLLNEDELVGEVVGLVKFPTVGKKENAETFKSSWQKLFGHLKIWDPGFNETHYPLGVDPGDEAEEFNYDGGRVISGRRALSDFRYIGRRGASLWAQGRYLKAHPKAQKKHTLLGIGVWWLFRDDIAVFPAYGWNDDGPGVRLHSLNVEFGPDCSFLLSKEKANKETGS